MALLSRNERANIHQTVRYSRARTIGGTPMAATGTVALRDYFYIWIVMT
jgi:hypothetical protein